MAHNKRDGKFTHQMANGSLYMEHDPPEGAKPYANISFPTGKRCESLLLPSPSSRLSTAYPRGATLGRSSQVNAGNFAVAPDSGVSIFISESHWLRG